VKGDYADEKYNEAYQKVTELNLPKNHPIVMGIALNKSVLTFELG